MLKRFAAVPWNCFQFFEKVPPSLIALPPSDFSIPKEYAQVVDLSKAGDVKAIAGGVVPALEDGVVSSSDSEADEDLEKHAAVSSPPSSPATLGMPDASGSPPKCDPDPEEAEDLNDNEAAACTSNALASNGVESQITEANAETSKGKRGCRKDAEPVHNSPKKRRKSSKASVQVEGQQKIQFKTPGKPSAVEDGGLVLSGRSGGTSAAVAAAIKKLRAQEKSNVD